LTGTYELIGDTLLSFGSGGITAIGYGALLDLDDRCGGNARVALAGSTTSNSALTGLTRNDGSLYLREGDSLTTNVSLANTGNIYLDDQGGQGGSTLTIGGTLTNTNYIQIGSGNNSLSAMTTLSAAGLTNIGTINLYGSAGATAMLTISGPVANSGNVFLAAGSVLDITGGNVQRQRRTGLDYRHAGAGLELRLQCVCAGDLADDALRHHELLVRRCEHRRDLAVDRTLSLPAGDGSARLQRAGRIRVYRARHPVFGPEQYGAAGHSQPVQLVPQRTRQLLLG
jgi:hypothetical protein